MAAWASFFGSTGVAAVALAAGEETGDELLARFRPLRVKSGVMTTGLSGFASLRQNNRSPGDWFLS